MSFRLPALLPAALRVLCVVLLALLGLLAAEDGRADPIAAVATSLEPDVCHEDRAGDRWSEPSDTLAEVEAEGEAPSAAPAPGEVAGLPPRSRWTLDDLTVAPAFHQVVPQLPTRDEPPRPRVLLLGGAAPARGPPTAA